MLNNFFYSNIFVHISYTFAKFSYTFRTLFVPQKTFFPFTFCQKSDIASQSSKKFYNHIQLTFNIIKIIFKIIFPLRK
jgi:hypothetical protein